MGGDIKHCVCPCCERKAEGVTYKANGHDNGSIPATDKAHNNGTADIPEQITNLSVVEDGKLNAQLFHFGT